MLSVFDLDKTLIKGDSYDLWHDFLLEKKILGDEFIEKNEEMGKLYDAGKLDMDTYIKFSEISLKSVSLDEISTLIPEFLESKILPIVHDNAKIWLNSSRNSQLIISATPEYIVKPIAHFLGVKHAIGVKLKIKNGYYISKYEKPMSYQEGKVVCLKNWLKDQKLKPKKIKFYTDSINDITLCKFADSVVCVSPDDELRAIAVKQNWEIVEI
ncbi:MAG: HAD-IB family hydrolase [Campylobacter sp.]|nr:HAD-IB family hydrolase [Campylobacter sp.]